MDKSVVLGFSGGIDSCTAAQHLRNEGYRVVALTINTTNDHKLLETAKLKAQEIGIEWLEYDANNMVAKVVAVPQRDDIDLPIEEHLIVELYSK